MKSKINIGTASIILIFIILCLSVFALLSLSDARSAQVFAERRANSVRAYYEVDALGQQYVKAASDAVKGGERPEDAIENAIKLFPDGTTSTVGETGNLICDIPMPSGQSLHIELRGSDAFVLSYNVYNSENYEIDTRLPVWTGNE